MQDAAPTCITLLVDCRTSGGHSNGHQGPTKWPLQIPSLTPSYFYFAGACQRESTTNKKQEYLEQHSWHRAATVPSHLLRKRLELGATTLRLILVCATKWLIPCHELHFPQKELLHYVHSKAPLLASTTVHYSTNQPSCSQVHLLNQSHTTVFINMFTATCWSSKCKPPSGLL